MSDLKKKLITSQINETHVHGNRLRKSKLKVKEKEKIWIIILHNLQCKIPRGSCSKGKVQSQHYWIDEIRKLKFE